MLTIVSTRHAAELADALINFVCPKSPCYFLPIPSCPTHPCCSRPSFSSSPDHRQRPASRRFRPTVCDDQFCFLKPPAWNFRRGSADRVSASRRPSRRRRRRLVCPTPSSCSRPTPASRRHRCPGVPRWRCTVAPGHVPATPVERRGRAPNTRR